MNPSHDQDKLTRRDLLRTAGLGLLGASCIRAAAAAAAPARSPAPALPPGRNRFARMMQEYWVERVREVERAADRRREALRTRQDALEYVREVRLKIARCFGPWPERTPLNAKVVGTLGRGAYSIEKVIFESRPGFLVTANLYLPSGRKGRLPGVLAPCGHYPDAKAAEPYQSFSQGLARLGYVVLIFDPLGQGERLQYVGPDGRLLHGRDGVKEHLYAGNQQTLVGESLATWRVWDGIRALDYLLSRPEVDPSRVGVTGNSGGGTDSTWLCGLDNRLTMAAPECFVTTIRRNLENELPTDPEQCPPGALEQGLDHSDFIAAMAPKPVVLIGQEKDMFDARGLEEAYGRLRRLYRLLGAEGNIKLVIESDYHAYSQRSREAMYAWFNRATGNPADSREPALALEKPADLSCTPEGQVAGLGSRPVYDFTREKSRRLRQARPALDAAGLRRAVADSLQLPPAAEAPDYRILRPETAPVYLKRQAGIYAVETEPRICTLVYRLSERLLTSRPPRGHRRALLHVCHLSSDAELRGDAWLEELARSETAPFYACDPRGLGESLPNTCDKAYDQPYGCDYFYAAYGQMMNRPYVGQRTFDLLRVIQWLKSCGHEEIHLAATGWGALPATFAALLSDEVVQVTLRHALTSYAEVAESEEYAWPLSAFVPGVLRSFDLPDCYRALAGKQLKLIEPWNAQGVAPV